MSESNSSFKKYSTAELNRLMPDDYLGLKKHPLILVLDNIRSLNNIGSLFRTADSLAIEGLYLCGITAKPPHREIRKTALGASETVEWKYFENSKDALLELKNQGFHVVAAEQTQNSTKLSQFEAPNKAMALVLGHEVNGVSNEALALCDDVIEIEQFGTKHSFNVSVSAGIICWELVRQMQSLNTNQV